MTAPVVVVEHPADGVALIRINRPEARNALNMEVRRLIARHLAEMGEDDAIRCIVLTGNDKSFAAGADIKEMAGAGTIEMMARGTHKLWRAIAACPKPVIAAVNGHAFGGGLGLVAAADIAIGADSALMSFSEVRIGAVPAMFTTYAYYNPDKFVYYGEEMMKSCMAYRSLLDAGVYACAGSDFSPGPFAALMGIQGMVTRKGWDGKTWGANQKISVSEAIAVNTYNGAWASGEEAIKGSITAGKLADYVVLADDPHTVDVEKIKDIQIVRTVVGGKTSYQA